MCVVNYKLLTNQEHFGDKSMFNFYLQEFSMKTTKNVFIDSYLFSSNDSVCKEARSTLVYVFYLF